MIQRILRNTLQIWQLGLALFFKEIMLKKVLEYEQLAKEVLKNMNFFKR